MLDWREHDGGACPCHGWKVMMKLRSGAVAGPLVISNAAESQLKADGSIVTVDPSKKSVSAWLWKNREQQETDILAWRAVPPEALKALRYSIKELRGTVSVGSDREPMVV